MAFITKLHRDIKKKGRYQNLGHAVELGSVASEDLMTEARTELNIGGGSWDEKTRVLQSKMPDGGKCQTGF